MGSNPPAYQYYAADFNGDTATWTNGEVGTYQRLLNYEWVNGWKSNEGLPDDPKRLAKIARCSYKKFQKRWRIISKKFSRNGDGFLINRRMEEGREELRQYRESQAEAGKRGVEVKKKRGIFPFKESSEPSSNGSTDPASRNQALQSSSSLKEEEKKTNKRKELDYSDLQQKTDNICKTLTTYFKQFNFYAWRQEQINNQRHPEAIEECLRLLWKKRKTTKNVRAYLTQLMKIKGPNPFERKAIQEHEKRKKEELGFDGSVLT